MSWLTCAAHATRNARRAALNAHELSHPHQHYEAAPPRLPRSATAYASIALRNCPSAAITNPQPAAQAAHPSQVGREAHRSNIETQPLSKPDGPIQPRFRLHRMRRRDAQVAGPVPALLGVEFARAAARHASRAAAGAARQRCHRSARCRALATAESRLASGQEELDRVLGGGIVPGSVTLLGRRPGHRQVDAAAAGGGAYGQLAAACCMRAARNPSLRWACGRSG